MSFMPDGFRNLVILRRLSDKIANLNIANKKPAFRVTKRSVLTNNGINRCKWAVIFPQHHHESRNIGFRAYFTSTNLKGNSTAFTENPFENDLPGYQAVVTQTMKELVDKCEELESLNIPGFEVNEKDGVFELRLGDKGTYVINKQGPNKQIWWSSPVSGPKRYNYDASKKAWRNSRDGHYLYDLFNQEITSLIGQEFDMYTIASKPQN